MGVFSRFNFISAAIISAVGLTVILADAQVKIVAGHGVTYFLKVNSEEGNSIPYGCGLNESNQMFAFSSSLPTNPPQQVMNNSSCFSCHNNRNFGTGMSDIAPSKYNTHVLAMGFNRSLGKVRTIGDNDNGQLGDGTNNYNYNYHKTNSSGDAKGIAAGFKTSFIITADNKLQACGRNSLGQLGTGTYNDELYFAYAKISGGADLTNVKSVSAGTDHTLILDGTGKVYVCGSNAYGQLGLGTSVSNTNLATQISDVNITNVKKVSAGANHSLVLKNDGNVYGFGGSNNGELKTSYSMNCFTPILVASGVSDIAAGGYYSLILKGNLLYGVGINNVGQLGCGRTPLFSFVEIATNVATFAAGYDHTVIQKTDGTFWACGNNEYGQLGDGTTNSTCNWVQVFLPVEYLFPDPSKTYLITNLNSNKVLQSASNTQGANVVQMSWTGLSNQLWKFVLGNGYYNIVNLKSGYYMDIYGAGTAPGAANVIWSSNGQRNQNWTLIDAVNGNFNIQNQNSGLNLDINGASTADGAQDIQWTPHGDDNQKWSINEGFVAYYTITASAGTNGSISPSGSNIVRSGYPYSYTITPNSGYMVDAVMVDNVNQGSITSYTFNGVNADHTISATFKSSTSTFPDPTKWYKIATRVNTNLCLNVTGGTYANNTAIELRTKSNVNQEFKFQSAGNGYYTITCRGNTSYSIDMGGNFANSQTLKLWTTSVSNVNQKFKLVPITGGYYRIETNNAGFSIDNWGAGGNGVKPALWTSSNTNTNQQWVITVVP